MDFTEEEWQILASMVDAAISREVVADWTDGSGDTEYARTLADIRQKITESITEAGR